MTTYSRRDCLRLGSMLAAVHGLDRIGALALADGLQAIFDKRLRVLWLQGMSCSGCSVSLLNSDEPGPLELITQVISLAFHSNLSSAQGHLVLETIDKVREEAKFVLIVEGSLCPKMPLACTLGGKPLTDLLPPLMLKAQYVLGAGSCAAYGGIPSAEGNPTGAMGLQEFMQSRGIPVEKRLLNCPGCPVHPHTLVTMIAHLAGIGYPAVDARALTPNIICQHSVHDHCPKFHYWQKEEFAEKFGDEGCLFKLGCLGPLSHTDCPERQWNGGTNWCIRAGAPCIGCTSENFARMRDFPFYRLGERQHDVEYTEADRKGAAS